MNNAPESNPITGHDGPYPAPIEISRQSVLPHWIDYNGHMNVGYYGIAFDKASDVVLSEHLGIGVEHADASGQGPYVLQTHQHHLHEMRLGEAFCVRFRLIGHDTKRLHLFAEMALQGSGVLCATQELVLMNVDRRTGRSADYPAWAVKRFARMQGDHAALARPAQLGAALGLYKKR